MLNSCMCFFISAYDDLDFSSSFFLARCLIHERKLYFCLKYLTYRVEDG